MQNLDLEKENGRSMIEMLGVLAIIGVLSVGGIAGYSKAMMKYKINKTIEQITLIAGNVRAFFAPQRSYAGFIINPASPDVNKLVHKAKLVPDEMMELNSNMQLSSVINEFGKQTTGASTGKNSYPGDDAFYLGFIIPQEACIELASQDWTNAGVSAINVHGGGGISIVDKTFTTPISVDDAVEWCEKAAKVNGGSVSLYFYFDININSTYWQNIINPSS